MNRLGIRKEEKPFETRVPLVPSDIQKLTCDYGIDVIVEPSSQRAFSEGEFISAGAKVGPITGEATDVVLGVKEMPIDFFEPNKTYLFFSHTIKGQPSNMPMLQRIIDVGATLIDYERIIDDSGRRLVFFGNWAGLAGMSDTLRVLGERIDYLGISPNPFSGLRPTYSYKDLHELKNEIRKIASKIENHSLPSELDPMVFGFAGYGNVSQGAQEIFDILPHTTVSPEELPNLKPAGNKLYKVVFEERHMVHPIDSSQDFDLQDYYTHGTKKYRGIFHKYIPYLTVLMNCIYWTKKYPRLITKAFIRDHWHDASRRLMLIGDISCDIHGAIEFTVQTTEPDRPAFTYLVDADQSELGVTGDGPVVIAVDNLPCELPREASTSFSNSLMPLIPALAAANFNDTFTQLDLPRELKDAVIVFRGELTTNYQYLKQYLN